MPTALRQKVSLAAWAPRDFESALFSAGTGIWEHDIASGRIYVHATMLSLLGMEPGDVPVMFDDWNRATMHPDDQGHWRDTYQRHLDGATHSYEHMHRRRHKNGSFRWLFSRGKVERDGAGRPVRMLGVATDVTELQRTRESLQQSQDRMRQIAEYSSDCYWLLEAPSGKVLYVSPSFERIWGYPAAHILDGSRRWVDAVLPEDRAMLRAMDLGHRRENWDVAYRLYSSSGQLRWVQSRGFPILKDGMPDRIAGVMKDITQERADDEQRLDVLRRQSQLLVREVHHRIKNSLQGVTGLLSIRQREHPEVAAVLGEAVTQIESVALVHGLQGAYGDGDISAAAMTRAIVDTASRFARSDVGLELVMSEPIPCRLAREKGVAVALVLNELITNAVKHSPVDRAATVRIEVEVEGANMTWRVSNPGELSRALDLATGQGLGTGLNLARSMLPSPGASLHLRGAGAEVTAVLRLQPPVIIVEGENR